MLNSSKLAPLIITSNRINNYTHLIANLKLKQNKYKDFSFKTPINAFSKILDHKQERFDLDSIINGYLHEKLKENFESYEKSINKSFIKSLNKKIALIKKENDLMIYNTKIGSIKDLEDMFFNKPSKYSFKDEFLFDIYAYISSKMTPIEFLQNSFLKYIKNFVHSNGKLLNSENILDHENIYNIDIKDDSILKSMVKEFVKLKYNRIEYNIEVFEDRYLWAEVYVLYRIGRQDLVLEHLSQFEIYFEFMTQKFKSAFIQYLEKKSSSHNVVVLPREDRFKRFMIDLIDSRVQFDGLVINTVEDYLWCKFMINKSIKKDIELYESPKIKFMISLFTKSYQNAIDIMLRSEFNVVAKFFILKEICLEQGLDKKYSEENDISDEKKAGLESSFSSFNPNLNSINPIFLNFMFGLVERFSSKDLKVRFIEILKHYPDYYETIPDYIIKYNLYEILDTDIKFEGDFGMVIDQKMADAIIDKLKSSGMKKELLRLQNIISKDILIDLLIDLIGESILTDEIVDEKLIENILVKTHPLNTTKLKHIYDFYKFSFYTNIGNLKNTILLDLTADLTEYKFIIEKIFPKAIDVAVSERDREIAKTLFKICGFLELNDECRNKAAKDLVSFI